MLMRKLLLGTVAALILASSPMYAAETCQGSQCQRETCSSDSCDDGIDAKACHPTHCHLRDDQLPTVPKAFRGTWVGSSGSVRITAATFDDIELTSIKPGDEGGSTILVTWALPSPANSVKEVWRLAKVNGREVLITVNEEHPVSIGVYQRNGK
jgi:hypothetical protein